MSPALMVSSVWKRRKQRPCLHAQRTHRLPLIYIIRYEVTKCKCHKSATMLLYTAVPLCSR